MVYFKLVYKVFILSLIGVFNLSAQAVEIKVSSGLATPVMEADKQQTAYLRVALTGFEIDNPKQRTPVNMAIVLDRSGSMSGEKIARARDAAVMAVSQLSDQDIVSIVTYDTSVNVVVPATKVADRDAIYKAIEQIDVGGSTALFAGVSKGIFEVKKFIDKNRVNRVILLSDGLANIGPSSPAELGKLGMAVAKDGVSITTIGLGLGYNEDLMTQLADYSDGSHFFVEKATELASIFQQELGKVLSVVAQDVEIEIHCDESITPLRIIGRDGDIIGNKVVTKMNQLYSAQEKYLVLEVAVAPQKVGSELPLADVKVVYNNMLSNKRVALDDRVTAEFSRSKELVKKSINKPVYEAAVEQVANIQTQEALALRDQGDTAAAQVKLEESASYLDKVADFIGSSRLKKQSEEAVQDADAVVNEKEWRKNRKSLKAKTYSRSKQQ